MAYICNISTWEGRQEDSHRFKANQGYSVKTASNINYKNKALRGGSVDKGADSQIQGPALDSQDPHCGKRSDSCQVVL